LGVPVLVWLRRWLHAGGTEQFPYPLTPTTLQGGSVSRSLLAHLGGARAHHIFFPHTKPLHPHKTHTLSIGVTAFLQSILLTASTDTELQAGQCDTRHPLSPRPYTHGNPSVIRRDTHVAIEGALHGSDLQTFTYYLISLTRTPPREIRRTWLFPYRDSRVTASTSRGFRWTTTLRTSLTT
jgi:hypothetical protein